MVKSVLRHVLAGLDARKQGGHVGESNMRARPTGYGFMCWVDVLLVLAAQYRFSPAPLLSDDDA